jgi:hypothetical protein
LNLWRTLTTVALRRGKMAWQKLPMQPEPCPSKELPPHHKPSLLHQTDPTADPLRRSFYLFLADTGGSRNSRVSIDLVVRSKVGSNNKNHDLP